MKRLRHVGRRVALLLLAVYLLVLAGLFLGQRSLVFPVHPARALDPTVAPLTVTFDGGTVPLVVLARSGAPLVVWFHGNGGQIANELQFGTLLRRHGLGFAAVEYPGYPGSVGVGPSEAHLLTASRAVLDRLHRLTADSIVCAGHSLGTAVAAAMAAEGRCDSLVLLAPFTSVADVAALRFPGFPVRLLLLDPFDTTARAADIHVPTLIVHGTRDDTVPVSLGRQLSTEIPGAVYIERDATHRTVVDETSFALVAKFLRGEPVSE